jgi:hypothetical protein
MQLKISRKNWVANKISGGGGDDDDDYDDAENSKNSIHLFACLTTAR